MLYVSNTKGADYMAQTDTFSFRMDAELKKKFESICAELGMSAAIAFNVYAATVVRERRIPFTISLESVKEKNHNELPKLQEKFAELHKEKERLKTITAETEEDFADINNSSDIGERVKQLLNNAGIPTRTQMMILYKYGFVDGSSHTNLETGKWIEVYNEGKAMSAEGVRKCIQPAFAAIAEHKELQSILNLPKKRTVNEIKSSDGSTVYICEVLVVFEDDTSERVAYSDSLSQEIAEIYAKRWTKEKTVKEVRLQDASGNVLNKYDF